MKRLMTFLVCIPLLVACNSDTAETSKDYAPANTGQNDTGQNDTGQNDSNMVADVSTEPELSPGEMYASLNDEFDTKMEEFRTAYQEADESERQSVYRELYPKPEDYGDRFMELAEAHPDDPAAVKALAWVATRIRRGNSGEQAMDKLFEHHVESDEMADVCMPLMYSRSSDAKERLEMLVEKSPHDQVKGIATFCLASRLKDMSRRDDSIEQDQYLAMFKTVVEDYADVEMRGRKIAEMAESSIFEIEHLSIGKEAPDIEGEDLDGVAFKLSDYRGKVVVLDFWGHW